ncbi:SCO family protein [Pseudomonadota bacterium]
MAASKPNSANSIEKFQYKSALSASQNAIGNMLSDHPLTNSSGQVLSLRDFQGKPLVLSLIYTSCYAICPITIKHLAKVVEKARDTLGTDSFSVAVLGFDANVDSPQAMKQFAKKQGIDDAQWQVLSADQDTVNALAKELGFLFFTSPNGFDHIVQASIIDADGQVYRQVYGETFETPLLVSPLMELILGRAAPKQSLLDDMINKVRLFCTAYDPASDTYSFDYSLFIGMIIGGVIILLAIAFIVREYRYGKNHPLA